MFTRSDRWVVFLVVLLSIYCSIGLLPHRWPAVGQSEIFFFYLLSLPLIVGALLVLAVVTLVVHLRSRNPGATSPVARSLLMGSVGGLFVFAVTILAGIEIGRSLPTGSQRRAFDRAVWNDPRSSDCVERDITPRQKMLADVVDRVLPGKTRREIEAELGLSLDTPYFSSTGRDLIYMTGPERDSLFPIDSEWLLIWLDENGRFKRYEIATD